MDLSALTELNDLQKLCRFCLKPQLQMRILHPEVFDTSNIAQMFLTITDIPLDMSPLYSQFLCSICENQMNKFCEFRLEFQRVANVWKECLTMSGISLNESAFPLKVELVEHDSIDETNLDDDLDSNNKGSPEGLVLTSRSPKVLVLTCDICGAEIHSRKLLLRHMSTQHGSRKTNKTSTRITEHKFQCKHCPKTFKKKSMMVSHERQHTGERPFICEMCAFSFTTRCALNRHCRMHSMPGSRNKIHQKVQETNRLRPVQTQPIPKLPPSQGIRPECPMCHNTYMNRMSIQRHMKLQHGAEGLVAWKQMIETTCMVCNQKFPTNEELMQHKPIHVEHHCPICQRRFHSKSALDLHVNNHSTKVRPFKCELCDATYLRAFTLKIHFKRAHTDERPFKCNQCDQAFVERSVMNVHIRKVHSIYGQLKKHQCTMCPEAFKSKDALRSHTEKHTGQYRYMCKLCQRNLYSGSQLTEHNRMYHPEKIGSSSTA